MKNYYSKKLTAQRLERCYGIAPPRIAQYLEAEINYVLGRIQPDDRVLELGAGYGRVLGKIAPHASLTVGIDVAYEGLRYAKDQYLKEKSCGLSVMNAINLGFSSDTFDVVLCIQNGISAFKEDPGGLIVEAMRVARPGGVVLFSSYSNKLWEGRLAWFRLQSEQGLIGEIDESLTGNGVIVCKDGFRATTIGLEEFDRLTSDLDKRVELKEVDNSSFFCEIFV